MPSESLFRKCESCGKGIAKADRVCKHCGAKRRRLSPIHWIGIVFLGLIILLTFSVPEESPSSSSSSAAKTTAASNAPDTKDIDKVYAEGETVQVGYMSYAVWRSWWTTRLSDNQYLHQDPDAMFLVVELTVRNDDSEARIIPNFELVDTRGATYESSSKASAVERAIGVLDSLNPGVDKSGVVVFDVPQKEGYKFKASGGFWSSEDALIELSPNQRGIR